MKSAEEIVKAVAANLLEAERERLIAEIETALKAAESRGFDRGYEAAGEEQSMALY